mgnify:CR=1 FL=1
MDQLRQALANIQQQIGKMNASQKLLLASLAVIATMTLFLVSQYASKPAMVDLVSAGGEASTVQALQAGGFDAQMIDGKVVLPDGQQRFALAYLSESGQLPGDTTLMFSNLIGSQDWKASSAQHRQQFNIALQNELSGVISKFSSISRANVILDVPQTSGLGRASRKATASVTLFTQSGGPISQDMVDAAARLVSGAVSGLTPDGVQVVDGTTGRARTTTNDEALSSTRYLDYAGQVEKHTQQKIETMFAHIPGVVVSVTARVDITSVQSTENKYLPKDEGSVQMLAGETKSSNSTSQTSRGAEPGVRSNQTASINTGRGSGTSAEDETGDTQFQVAIGQKTTSVVDPRGMPTQLNSSVIIPQEYIESIIKRSRPEVEGEEPASITSQEAQDFFESIRLTFESLVRPHLVGVGPQGEPVTGNLTVSMAPLGLSLISGGGAQSVGLLGSLAGGNGGGGMLGSTGGLIEKAMIGVLAFVSFVMMFMMMKRTGKNIELPSAQELVGVPPHLETLDDLVGEASEGEHVMTGIEIDDQLVEVQQLREQVAELIKQDPESAAGLVDRWATHEVK